MEIPNSELRREIHLKARDGTLSLPEIVKVEDRERHRGKVCYGYALGNHSLTWTPRFDWKGIEGFTETHAPQPGDVALYFEMIVFSVTTEHGSVEERRRPIPQHAGIYLGDSRVRSKWGLGDVYEHPIDFVPSIYGNEVRFFRKELS